MKSSTKPLLLGFYGDSTSGKTTLLENLLTELNSQNYRIAVVKISGHAVSLDSKSKDTDRFSKAGADPVVLASQTTTAYLVQKSSDEVEIISNLKRMAQLDCIFIEGSRDKNIPKIRLGERVERANTLFTYDGNFEKILTFITQLFKKEK
jgi:molybdopterin-guanine dinucleotide biosynthesis protein MobB